MFDFWEEESAKIDFEYTIVLLKSLKVLLPGSTLAGRRGSLETLKLNRKLIVKIIALWHLSQHSLEQNVNQLRVGPMWLLESS